MTTVEPIRNLSDLKKVEFLLEKNKRNLLLFTLGINSGLRISDILALDVQDVKDKKFIQITEKRQANSKKFQLIQN